jgi:hypothetical protein
MGIKRLSGLFKLERLLVQALKDKIQVEFIPAPEGVCVSLVSAKAPSVAGVGRFSVPPTTDVDYIMACVDALENAVAKIERDKNALETT